MTATSPLGTTPLELLGVHVGPRSVDPGTILARQWYFDGKFLRSDAFRQDQAYVRNLVALSNTALGHGIVHGFTARRGSGDQIRVEAGLALAPSGRPILLTTPSDLSIAELLAQATGSEVGTSSGLFGSPDFGVCTPIEEPDTPGATGSMWVLYARSIDVPCGEEERFGQLCEDACATETDHATVVEGVGFFVEPHPLTLPGSSVVPLSGRHLRSRYASAYYAWERNRTTSFVSGAGLRSDLWCNGAEGVSGTAVPLAVFDRTGGVTSFVDAWTARRELIETGPQRYWQWRTARRPWDVFLAQVLQFQCQLTVAANDPGTAPDECQDERDALAATNELLAGLAGAFEGGGNAVLGDVAAERGKEPIAHAVAPEAFVRIEALRKQVVAVLGKGISSTSGSLLIDHGFVQVPSAGYLPTDPERDVAAQVRAWFGPGVDLRFCAVRADFIGEALAEAQHMDRISLTQGIDDLGNLEEVDVLVPDGEMTSEPVATSDVFEGSVQFRPQFKLDEDGEGRTGAALEISAVAREHDGAQWSWTLAGIGEVGDFDLPKLFAASLADAKVSEAEEALAEEEAVEVPFVDHHNLKAARTDAAAWQRVNREKYYAHARRSRVDAAAFDNQFGMRLDEDLGIDRKLRQGDPRPMALWLDVGLDMALTSLGIGQQTPATLRLAAYSRAKVEPAIIDVRITGSLEVTDVSTGQAGGMVSNATTVRTRLTGHVDPLFVLGTSLTIDKPATPIDDLELTWQVGTRGNGGRVVLVSAGRTGPEGAGQQISLKALDNGTPRHIEGIVSLATSGRSFTETHLGEGTRQIQLASMELDQLTGGFEGSPTARTIGEAAISVIGAELALPGRDPGFSAVARERLFGGSEKGAVEDRVTAKRDWVFFHRRRTKQCGAVDAPVQTRRYRLHHATVDDPEILARFRRLWGVHARTADELPGFEAEDAVAEMRRRNDLEFVKAYEPVSDLGFQPVAVVEFQAGSGVMNTSTSALRTAWQAADRGSRLLLSAGGDVGAGDGETVIRARLGTVRGAVADLIDVRGAPVAHLGEIPPEFRDPGLDGVLLTVGLREPEVEIGGCIRLIRLSREALKTLERLVAGGDVADLDLDELLAKLNESGFEIDEFVATFDDASKLLNADDVRHWFGPAVGTTAVPLISEATVEAGEADLYGQRAEVLVETVGGIELNDVRTIRSTGDCGAAIVVFDSFFDTGPPVHGFARG